MIAVTVNELDAFRELALEYERSLPEDLRHRDAEAAPDVAFVARSEGRPVGCVALFELTSTVAIMKRLYVQPTQRGRGVARTLLDEFTRVARERGFERIVLDTDRERLNPAYLLYRSLGFAECAPYGPVDYATPTFMELILTRQ